MEMSSENYSEYVPQEITDAANQASLNLLPDKSKTRYQAALSIFEQWCSKKNVKCINETVILAYFSEKSKTSKASTLWSHYSMLKSTLIINKNIDIKYPKVIAFLNKKSTGYKAKKSKVFTCEEVNKFLHEADDNTFLMMKVNIAFFTVNPSYIIS